MSYVEIQVKGKSPKSNTSKIGPGTSTRAEYSKRAAIGNDKKSQGQQTNLKCAKETKSAVQQKTTMSPEAKKGVEPLETKQPVTRDYEPIVQKETDQYVLLNMPSKSTLGDGEAPSQHFVSYEDYKKQHQASGSNKWIKRSIIVFVSSVLIIAIAAVAIYFVVDNIQENKPTENRKIKYSCLLMLT